MDAILVDTARLVRDALVIEHVDFRLIGGLALEFQGIETGTTDLDLLVAGDDFTNAQGVLARVTTPLRFMDDGRRVPNPIPITYIYTGADGIDRPVSFFQHNDVDIDLLGAAADVERAAMMEPPFLSRIPKGLPVAPLGAILAIKLTVARDKDIDHAERAAVALGRINSKTISAYLRSRGFPQLIEEWEAAVLRATTPPRVRH